jgi:hypothetical protein
MRTKRSARKVTVKVRLSRDEDGYWTAVARLGPQSSAISDGPTLARAKERIRQAVAVHFGIRDSQVQLKEDLALPGDVKRALARVQRERAKLEAASTATRDATREAVKRLSKLGLSRRDTGALLGISGPRVQQVLDDGK